MNEYQQTKKDLKPSTQTNSKMDLKPANPPKDVKPQQKSPEKPARANRYEDKDPFEDEFDKLSGERLSDIEDFLNS